ncbi:MAG: ubiquinol-cytochrome c reductase iron-sulfur subunit [Flavobacteriales bacterium]
MDRKKFIKNSCMACAALASGGVLLSMLQSCSSISRISSSQTKSRFQFPLSSFGTGQMLIVQRNDAEFDALVVKQNDYQYITLDMMCTHQSQPLTANTTGLYCPSHGSRFGLDGKVLSEPATQSLKQYKTELQDQAIIIYFK